MRKPRPVACPNCGELWDPIPTAFGAMACTPCRKERERFARQAAEEAKTKREKAQPALPGLDLSAARRTRR